MRKKIFSVLAAVMAVTLTFTACSNDNTNSEATSDTTTAEITTTTEAVTDTAESEIEPSESITETNVAVVEGAPENTTTEAAAETPPEEEVVEETFPIPTPTAGVINEELLEELKGIVIDAIAMENFTLGYIGDNITSTVLEEESTTVAYRQIDPEFASSTSELIEIVGAPFATYFWADEKGYTLENILTVNNVNGGILVKSVSGELAYRCSSHAGTPLNFDFDSMVLLSITGEDEYAELCLVATDANGEAYWRTYTMINGFRGWVVESYTQRAVTGEVYLFEQMLVETKPTLEKIFGGANPVIDASGNQVEKTIIVKDDPHGNGVYYGLQVEAFMSIQEMREYLQSIFISDIADAYISLYINGVYIEQDGELFISQGAVMPILGDFDTSSYQTQSYDTEHKFYKGFIDWSDGTNSLNVVMGITRDSGSWKISTKLPFSTSKVIIGVVG